MQVWGGQQAGSCRATRCLLLTLVTPLQHHSPLLVSDQTVFLLSQAVHAGQDTAVKASPPASLFLCLLPLNAGCTCSAPLFCASYTVPPQAVRAACAGQRRQHALFAPGRLARAGGGAALWHPRAATHVRRRHAAPGRAAGEAACLRAGFWFGHGLGALWVGQEAGKKHGGGLLGRTRTCCW